MDTAMTSELERLAECFAKTIAATQAIGTVGPEYWKSWLEPGRACARLIADSPPEVVAEIAEAIYQQMMQKGSKVDFDEIARAALAALVKKLGEER